MKFFCYFFLFIIFVFMLRDIQGVTFDEAINAFEENEWKRDKAIDRLYEAVTKQKAKDVSQEKEALEKKLIQYCALDQLNLDGAEKLFGDIDQIVPLRPLDVLGGFGGGFGSFGGWGGGSFGGGFGEFEFDFGGPMKSVKPALGVQIKNIIDKLKEKNIAVEQDQITLLIKQHYNDEPFEEKIISSLFGYPKDHYSSIHKIFQETFFEDLGEKLQKMVEDKKKEIISNVLEKLPEKEGKKFDAKQLKGIVKAHSEESAKWDTDADQNLLFSHLFLGELSENGQQALIADALESHVSKGTIRRFMVPAYYAELIKTLFKKGEYAQESDYWKFFSQLMKELIIKCYQSENIGERVFEFLYQFREDVLEDFFDRIERDLLALGKNVRTAFGIYQLARDKRYLPFNFDEIIAEGSGIKIPQQTPLSDVSKDEGKAGNVAFADMRLEDIKWAEKTNYYDVLGVSQGASDTEIKTSFRRKAMKLHPDKNPDHNEVAEKLMKMLVRAYEVLIDPTKRRQYDQTVGITIESNKQEQKEVKQEVEDIKARLQKIKSSFLLTSLALSASGETEQVRENQATRALKIFLFWDKLNAQAKEKLFKDVERKVAQESIEIYLPVKDGWRAERLLLDRCKFFSRNPCIAFSDMLQEPLMRENFMEKLIVDYYKEETISRFILDVIAFEPEKERENFLHELILLPNLHTKMSEEIKKHRQAALDRMLTINSYGGVTREKIEQEKKNSVFYVQTLTSALSRQQQPKVSDDLIKPLTEFLEQKKIEVFLELRNLGDVKVPEGKKLGSGPSVPPREEKKEVASGEASPLDLLKKKLVDLKTSVALLSEKLTRVSVLLKTLKSKLEGLKGKQAEPEIPEVD